MSRIRADQLVNRAGSGGPKFPNGVAEGFSVSGIVTATSFRGDGSQLTGIDASSLKDGSNVKVQAVSGGANVTGNVAATGNVSAVNATFSGDLTVNGTTTTIDTAVTSVDSLSVDGNVGIGLTNPTSPLTVKEVSNVAIELLKTTNTSILTLGEDGSSGGNINAPNGALSLSQGGTERLHIDSTGRIGVGTDSFSDAAEVMRIQAPSGQNNTLVTIKANSTTGFSILNFGDNDFNEGRIIYDHSDNSMQFRTDDAERLRITSSGHILPGADNTQDLGSSAKRFANIYTGDLNLSNEGSANDVDGTWGQYTIQEGEDDLFLINRRTGKKYKFNLTEVD